MTKTTDRSQAQWYRSLTKIAMIITSVILTMEQADAAKGQTAVVMMTDYHYNKDADDKFVALIDKMSKLYERIVIVMNGDNEVKTHGERIIAKTLEIGKYDLDHKQIPTNDMVAQWSELNYIVGINGRHEVEKSIVQGEVAARLFYDMMHRAKKAAKLDSGVDVPTRKALDSFLAFYTEERQPWYGDYQVTTHAKILESFLNLPDGDLKRKFLALLRKLHDRSGPKPRSELLERIHDIGAVKEIIIGLGNHEVALQKNLGFYMVEMKRRCPKVHFVATLPWKTEELDKLGIKGTYRSTDGSLGFVQWMDPVKLRLDSGDLIDDNRLKMTTTGVRDGKIQKELQVLVTARYENEVKARLSAATGEGVKHVFVLAHQDVSGVDAVASFKTIGRGRGINKIYYNHEGIYTEERLDAQSVMTRIIGDSHPPRVPITVVCGHGHKAGREIGQLENDANVRFVTPDPYGISVVVVVIDKEGRYCTVDGLSSPLETMAKSEELGEIVIGPYTEYYRTNIPVARIRLRNVGSLMTKGGSTIAEKIKKHDGEGEISFGICRGPHEEHTWDLDE
jgi:hypothetical protein